MPAPSAKPSSSTVSRRARAAVWPWLVMPLVVLVVFYVLYHLRQPPQPGPASVDSPSAEVPGAAGEDRGTPTDGTPR